MASGNLAPNSMPGDDMSQADFEVARRLSLCLLRVLIGKPGPNTSSNSLAKMCRCAIVWVRK